jgi:hypothetical protein
LFAKIQVKTALLLGAAGRSPVGDLMQKQKPWHKQATLPVAHMHM